MKKKYKKSKNLNVNQKSFYFEDYFLTNQKKKNLSKFSISEDRIYVLFFFYLSLILIFTIKISFLSIQNPELSSVKKNNLNFLPLRRDMTDRNGIIISRNIRSYHAAVNPRLIKDKEKFLLNIQLHVPDIKINDFKKKLSQNKYFYLKKRITEEEKNTLWSLGEKGIIFESYQSRVYPHKELFSHILGQVDDDNYGISGAEHYFDKELKELKNINNPISLTIDTNIQFLIKNELEDALEDFKAKGAAGLLLNNSTGEVLSLVSLPDYNINLRQNIGEHHFTNKITKGMYELGSIFKTFTIAIAINEKILEPSSIINNIKRNIKCSKYVISDMHEFPTSMTVEDILIQSSNIGAIKIARKVGQIKYKQFIKNLNLLTAPEFELNEIGTPKQLKWNKCKLETVSFGHGIMISPLQATTAYAIISNGGYEVKPSLLKKNISTNKKKIISNDTSKKMNVMLRKVVTDEDGTASLANIFGYQVGGKTGTAQNYKKKNENINTFISIFPSSKPKYVLFIMLDDPQPAPHLIYNYKGKPTKVNRNEAGWNSVYVAGKIIEKIGPILAINNKEIYINHVVKKTN